jgi:CRP/FNR family transcriptional regulator
MIYKQGGLVSNIMIVESGLVKVFIENESNVLVLKIITAGNLLGLTSLSEKNNTYQYNAMAYVDSVIRQIDINAFRSVVKQNPVFAKEIIDMLNSNSIQINNRFFCLSHKQSFGRLADILLCLSERVFKETEFELPLSRKELAELTGLKPETVIRLLKQFSDEGIIHLNGKKINIKDNQTLKKISEKG